MERVTRYRKIVQAVLARYDALLRQQPPAGVESHLIFDEHRDEYLLVKSGWSPEQRRVRGIVVHVRLKDGKVWVEEDWTEDGVATDLLDAGIPKEDIVLAFQPPEVRPLSEFAVA
jgi:hypothetical protein